MSLIYSGPTYRDILMYATILRDMSVGDSFSYKGENYFLEEDFDKDNVFITAKHTNGDNYLIKASEFVIPLSEKRLVNNKSIYFKDLPNGTTFLLLSENGGIFLKESDKLHIRVPYEITPHAYMKADKYFIVIPVNLDVSLRIELRSPVKIGSGRLNYLKKLKEYK